MSLFVSFTEPCSAAIQAGTFKTRSRQPKDGWVYRTEVFQRFALVARHPSPVGIFILVVFSTVPIAKPWRQPGSRNQANSGCLSLRKATRSTAPASHHGGETGATAGRRASLHDCGETTGPPAEMGDVTRVVYFRMKSPNARSQFDSWSRPAFLKEFPELPDFGAGLSLLAARGRIAAF